MGNLVNCAVLPTVLCATLFVDSHVSHSSVECDNTGDSSEDSSTAPQYENPARIWTLGNVNWTDLLLGRMWESIP